jgi:2,3-diketo-5-methylthio-1-phosphopentane phosphatase
LNSNINTKSIVFCDFDGTITNLDTLVFLLDHYSNCDWRKIEDKMSSGELSEREGLKMEIESLNVSWSEAIARILSSVKMDDHFPLVVNYLKTMDIPLIIMSGGIEEIIRTILEKQGLDHLEVRANRLKIEGEKWRIIPSPRPKIRGLCNHCKTSSLVEASESGLKTIYIGDGLTDRCPAVKADMLFAKGELENFCQTQAIPYYPYENFKDILMAITSIRNLKPVAQEFIGEKCGI